MAGPYASVGLVKQLGGLNESSDYLLFRYASPDELDAAITRQVAVVSAGLTEDIPAIYGAPTAGQTLLLAEGEAYLALSLLCMSLKSRRVFGTHWPLDQEDSSRFQELIDNEFQERAQSLLGRWLTVIEEKNAFAKPVFLVSTQPGVTTDTTRKSEVLKLLQAAEVARGPVDWGGLVPQP